MVNMATFLRRTFVVVYAAVSVAIPVLMAFPGEDDGFTPTMGVMAGIFLVLMLWALTWALWRVGVWLSRLWRGA